MAAKDSQDTKKQAPLVDVKPIPQVRLLPSKVAGANDGSKGNVAVIPYHAGPLDNRVIPVPNLEPPKKYFRQYTPGADARALLEEIESKQELLRQVTMGQLATLSIDAAADEPDEPDMRPE